MSERKEREASEASEQRGGEAGEWRGQGSEQRERGESARRGF